MSTHDLQKPDHPSKSAMPCEDSANSNPFRQLRRRVGRVTCYGLARLLAMICITCLGISAGSAQGRVALLLAAQNYQHFNAARVSVAQHQALAQALRDQGFAVSVATDPGNAAARAALADFSRKADRADFALIIASGHVATYRKQSFFLPTNARVRRATDLFSRGLSVANIADIAHRAKAGAFLMLVTVPDIPSTVAGIDNQPGFARPLPDNVVATFSSSNKVPVSRVDSVSQQAMQKVIETARQNPMSLARLIDSASASGAGRIFGSVTDLNLSQDRSQPKPEPAKPAVAVTQKNDAEREERERAEERIRQAEERARQAELRAREAEAKARRDLAAAASAAAKRAAAARREAEEKAKREIAAVAAAAARKAEEARRAEAARKAEAERRAEAERLAAAARQAAADREAARQVELARQAEASRQAEAERQAEAARQAEAVRQAEAAREAEAARKAEAERRLAEARATAPPQPAVPNIQSLQVVEALLGRGQRRIIQRILKSKGYYNGPLDAIFGDGTRAAIRAFQRDEGAAETGYLTPDQFQQLIASR